MLHSTNYFHGAMYPYGNEPKVRDYLIPQILGFINMLDEGRKGRLQEVYLLRSRNNKMFISAGSATVYFRVEANASYLAELTEDLRECFGKHMENAGIKARVTVYDAEWLKAPANSTFVEAIRDNGLLVWSSLADVEYITAKECIDNYYSQNMDFEHSNKDVFEKDALYRFISEFPKLDWVAKNKAIMEKPINYKDNVDEFVYATVLALIKTGIAEYYLHTPKWVKEAQTFNDPFGYPPQPFNDSIERDNL